MPSAANESPAIRPPPTSEVVLMSAGRSPSAGLTRREEKRAWRVSPGWLQDVNGTAEGIEEER